MSGDRIRIQNITEVRGLDTITGAELAPDKSFVVVNLRRIRGQREAFSQYRLSLTELISITGASGLVTVSGNDTTPGTLLDKLTAGTNITLVENNDGGNETITINAAGGSSVSLGTTTQIPYMNPAGDDYLYSPNLVFDGSILSPNIVNLSDGSSSSTSIRFNGAGANTGIYYSGGFVRFAHSGNDRFFFNSAGLRLNSPLSTTGGVTIVSQTGIPGAGFSIPSLVTVATDDKVLIWDTSDSDIPKYVTAQDIADLGGGGGATNLAYVPGTRTVTSSTGTDAIITIFTSTEAGLVPLSGGGTSNFLRADGTWATPAGSITESTYTPTVTNITNIDSTLTNGTVYYWQIGDTVFVQGSINVDHTANGVSELDLSLPVASNLVNGALIGHGAIDDNTTMETIRILANTTDDRAKLRWYYNNGPVGGNRAIYFSFHYRVL